MGGALVDEMNAITFAIKRAFHGFLRVTRKPLQSLSPGLTAARFDMMYVLLTGTGTKFFWNGTTYQREVQRALGVSAPVVSRMLRSLEELGWVTRKRSETDRRQREVSLTQAGTARIRDAYAMFRKAAMRLVCLAICFGRHHSADHRLVHMETLESYLRALCDQWFDKAQLYYRWGHPDD
jgi:DNA-binding MarR family transcriptional regulator